MLPILSQITTVDQAVLRDSSCLSEYSIAKRMAWAAKRWVASLVAPFPEPADSNAVTRLSRSDVFDAPALDSSALIRFSRLAIAALPRLASAAIASLSCRVCVSIALNRFAVSETSPLGARSE